MDGMKWISPVLYVADGNVETMYMEHSSNYSNSNRASRRGAASEDL